MPNKHACFFLRINLTINVAHPDFLMHTQSLLSGYAPELDHLIIAWFNCNMFIS